MAIRPGELNNVCVQSGPLSPRSSYSLFVNGYWGHKEVTNLIKILELERQWLEADALVAQGIEQGPSKPEVAGSIPAECATPHPTDNQ